MINPKGKRKRLVKLSGGKCFYCGKKIHWKRNGHRKKATIDHYIPQAEGGGNEIDNLRAACLDCNHKKGRMMPEEFRSSLAQ